VPWPSTRLLHLEKRFRFFNEILPLHHPLISYSPMPFPPPGAQFVDYALGDWIATPPEHSGHFSERLVLLSASFHANSHASQYSHITEQHARSRCSRGHGQGGPALDDAGNLVDLVVPHAFYKLDLHLLSTWRGLVSSPGPLGERARLVFAQKAHFRKALPNIRMLLGGLNASFIKMAGLQETR
jgi:hypothetical protein